MDSEMDARKYANRDTSHPQQARIIPVPFQFPTSTKITNSKQNHARSVVDKSVNVSKSVNFIMCQINHKYNAYPLIYSFYSIINININATFSTITQI